MASKDVDKLLTRVIEEVSFMFNILHHEINYITRTFGTEGIHSVLVSLLNALEIIHLNLDEVQNILDNNQTNSLVYQTCKHLTVHTVKKPLVASYFTQQQNQKSLKEYFKHKTYRLRTFFYKYTNTLISKRLWKCMHAKKKSRFVQSLLFFCLDYVIGTTHCKSQCTDQYRHILNLCGAFLFCHWYPYRKYVEFNEILFLKSTDGMSDPLRSRLRFPFEYLFVQYLHGNKKDLSITLKNDSKCSREDILQIKNYSQSSICTWTPPFVVIYFNNNFYYRPSDFEDLSQFTSNMPSSSNCPDINIGSEMCLSDDDLKSNDLLLNWNYIERRYAYLEDKEMPSTSTGLYDWRRCYGRFANVLIPSSSVSL